MRFSRLARTWNEEARRAALLLTVLVTGCAQVPDVSKFLYATNADRDDAVIAADADASGQNDVAVSELGDDADALGTDVAGDVAPDAVADADTSDAASDALADADAATDTDVAVDADAVSVDVDTALDTEVADDASLQCATLGACDDGDACTTDSCIDGVGCTHIPWTVTACDDGKACTTDSCAKLMGCVHTPIDVSVTCGDGDACTVDLCEDVTGCYHVATNCDDNKVCTDDTCAAPSGCAHAPVSCDDGKDCTADTCDALTGCLHGVLTGTPCNDEDACTNADTCAAGTCGGTAVGCDDGDPCTTDGCNTLTGCAHTLNPAATCDDGDACTANDTCATGVCAGTLRLWQANVGASAGQSALAMTPRPGGGAILVMGGTQLSVTAWGAGGNLLWTQTIAVASSRAGVTIGTTGDIAVVYGNGTDGQISLFGADGTSIVTTTAPSGSTGELTGILTDASGGYHAIGWIKAGKSASDAWVIDVDAKGAVSNSGTAGSGGTDALYAAAIASDGKYLVGGTSSSDIIGTPFVLKTVAGALLANNSQIWSYNFPSVGAGSFRQIVAASDGGALAVGAADVDGSGLQVGITVRLDGNGKALWTRVDSAKGSQNVVSGAASLGDDRWLTGALVGGNVVLNALASDGSVLWTHTVGIGSAPQLLGVADGTVVMAGLLGGVAKIQRVDRYGNATCAASKGCLDTDFATCGDGNPCTTDDCTSGTCLNAQGPSGAPCGDGNACHAGATCASGSCVGGADFLGVASESGYTEGVAIRALTNGGWVVLSAGDMSGKGTVLSYTATGQLSWSYAVSPVNGSAMFTASNNDTCVLTYDSMSGTATLRRLSSAGVSKSASPFVLKGVSGFIFAGGVEWDKVGYLAVGTDVMQGYLLQFDAAGQFIGSHILPDMTVVKGVVAAPDGDLYIAGSVGMPPASTPFVGKYTPWGDLVWRYDYPSQGGALLSTFNGPVLQPDGGCAVAAVSSQAQILRFKADGTLRQTDTFSTGSSSTGQLPAALAATTDGSVILSVAASTPMVWRVDPFGNVPGAISLLAAPGPSVPVSVAASNSDRIALTSRGTGGTTGSNLTVWRTDAFLNDTCAASGTCAVKSPTDCSTSNSCVVDSCAAGACLHFPRKEGSPCTDGKACTWQDTCSTSVCQSGTPLLGAFPGKADEGNAVVASGTESVTVSNASGANSVVVEKRDATGKALWQQTAKGMQVADAHPYVDSMGNILVPGRDLTAGSAWLWQLDTDGKPSGSGYTFGMGNGSEFRAVIVNQLGSLYAAGSTNSPGMAKDFWLVPLTPALGQNGSAWTVGTTDQFGNSNDDTLASAAMGSDGKAFLIGTSGAAGAVAQDIHLCKVDPTTGAVQWQYTSKGVNAMGSDVAALADGGCIAVGSMYGKNSFDVWIARFNSNGAQQWSHTLDDNNGAGTDDLGLGVAELTDGTFALVGRTTASHLWRFGAQGTPLGDWPLTGWSANRVAQAGTGGLLIAARSVLPTAADLLLHTDLFGNEDCTASGVCLDYGSQSCDDNNPCTLDVCAAGCKHTNLPDGDFCSDGAACAVEQTCKSGVCGSGLPALWQTADGAATSLTSVASWGGGFVTGGSGNGKVSLSSWGWGGTSTAQTAFKGTVAGTGRVQLSNDGGLVFAGHTTTLSDPDGWIAKLSPTQQVIWSSNPGQIGGSDVLNAVVPNAAGGYWAVGTHAAAGGSLACWLQSVADADGALGKAYDLSVPLPGANNSCENARSSGTDGAFVVVGSLTVTGSVSGYIAGVNADGSTKWTSSFAGGSSTWFFDVAPTGDGGAIAVGTTAAGTIAHSNVAVVRFGPNGVKMWARSLDFANGIDEGRGINLRPDGSIDVAGTCDGKFCLMHLSALGTLQWSQTYGTDGRALAIAPAGYNGLVLAGESSTAPLVRVDWSGNATCAESGKCMYNGATNCSSGDECFAPRCSAGQCIKTSVADGGQCDDGDPCTGADSCQFGKCAAGTGSPCGDGICACGETIAGCPLDCQ